MKYWELDETGQPTQKIIERRRSAKFIAPIPRINVKPLHNRDLYSTKARGFRPMSSNTTPTSIINEVRDHVDVMLPAR